MKLYGNYTALITPFTKSNKVNFSTLKNLAIKQVEANNKGLVALGSTAEAPTLTNLEKHKIIETIKSETPEGFDIITGVNAFSLDDAIKQSLERFIDGASAILISPPPYIKPTQAGLYHFFKTIADYSYIPIILYNIPSRSGISISLDTITKLSSHPNIIGIKEASGDLTFATNLVFETKNNNFEIINGNDNLLLPMLSVGSKSIISVVGNVLPSLCNQIIDLFLHNSPQDALTLYHSYQEIINSLSIESNPIPIKYIMSKIGLINPYYRAPLCSPTQKNKLILNRAIEKSPLKYISSLDRKKYN